MIAMVHERLEKHTADDNDKFKRMVRMEIAIYGLYAALALYSFLLDHPKLITNNSALAAEVRPNHS